jgi:xylose isomerase
VFAFLQGYGLTNEVKVNIEADHASLAGLMPSRARCSRRPMS